MKGVAMVRIRNTETGLIVDCIGVWVGVVPMHNIIYGIAYQANISVIEFFEILGEPVPDKYGTMWDQMRITAPWELM